jgi:hypothetical protein
MCEIWSLAPEQVLKYATQDLKLRNADEDLRQVLTYFEGRRFSQVIINKEGEYQILRAEGITRWIEKQTYGDGFLADKPTVADALEYEPPGRFVLIGRSEPAFWGATTLRSDSNRE